MKRIIAGLLVAFTAALSGCGGSGGGSVAAPATVSGTASQGAPIAAGTAVSLKDAKGAVVTAAVKANGAYTIGVAGMTPPYVVNSGGFYSYAANSGVTNINPFTHLCMQIALGTSAISGTTVLPANFQTSFTAAVLDLKAKTDPLYPASIPATQKDFLGGTIVIASGVDKAFDSMIITPPDAAGNFAVSMGGQPILNGARANGMPTMTANAAAITAARAAAFPIPVSSSATFTSKVYDYSSSATGVPLAGVSVTTGGIAPAITATTDANGSFVLAGIPLNTPFFVKMSKATYSDTYSNTFPLTANMDNSDRPYAQYLPAKLTSLSNTAGNGVIRGRVVDERDPVNGFIGGALVTATDQVSGTAYPVRYTDSTAGGPTKTETNGLYVIVNIPAGRTVTVTATRLGYTYNTRAFTVYADSISQARIFGTTAPATFDGQYANTRLLADGFTHLDSYDVSGTGISGVHSFSKGTVTGNFTLSGTIVLNTGAVSGNVVINNIGVRNTTFTGTVGINDAGSAEFCWTSSDPTFGAIGGCGYR